MSVEQQRNDCETTTTLVCEACPRKGGKGSKRPREYWEEGTACKDAVVFLVFNVHLTNVKISLIGQILCITESVVLIGQRLAIQERRSSQIHSFNILTHVIGLNYP